MEHSRRWRGNVSAPFSSPRRGSPFPIACALPSSHGLNGQQHLMADAIRTDHSRADPSTSADSLPASVGKLIWLPSVPLRYVSHESPISGEFFESAPGFHIARLLSLPPRLLGVLAILFGFCRRTVHEHK